MIHERLEDTVGEVRLAGDSLAYNGFIRRLHKVLDRMGSCGVVEKKHRSSVPSCCAYELGRNWQGFGHRCRPQLPRLLSEVCLTYSDSCSNRELQPRIQFL